MHQGGEILTSVLVPGKTSERDLIMVFVTTQIWISELFAAMMQTESNHPDNPIFNSVHGG